MEVATSVNQQKLISSFVEIAAGQTIDSAQQFLKATSWNLEEAINLFLIQRDYDQALPYQNSTEQYFSNHQEDHIRPPLPSKKDTLYDDSSMDQTSTEVCPSEIWDSEADSTLSSLYRPSQNLLFNGSFEDAKLTSSRKNLWLLVNLQSMTEFASHTLNRDLWSDVAVSETIMSSFTLWQTYDHTTEGKKISTYYKIGSLPPVVLLIDPITGQKMRSWSGVIEAQSFIKDLSMFTDVGPSEYIASRTSNKRIKTEPITCSSSNQTNQDSSTFWEDDLEDLEDDVEDLEDDVEDSEEEETNLISSEKEETCLEFPDLTEEPKGDCDQSLVCSICIRFPDGRRKQRKFLKSEPIQLLWSFCHSHMEESEEKAFKLVDAIPGASKTLDYGANMTLEQSGIANSMISVTWE